MKDLEPQKRFWIEQVAATMAIEDMPTDGRTYGHLRQIAAGQYSIRINGQYHICFRVEDNKFYDVEIVDYH